MIRLFATDLDGTLLETGKPIARENIEAAKYATEKGVIVTVATGRMYSAALPIAKELDVDSPIITYNGALIKSVSGKVYYENYIDEDIVREVIAISKAKNWHLNVYSDDKLYYAEHNAFTDKYEIWQGLKGKAATWDGLNDYTAKVTKLLSFSNSKEETAERCKFFGDAFKDKLTITSSTDFYTDMSNLGVTKASGLRELAKVLNIPIEETMAIGDADNDLPMLKAAGKSVAMGNAKEHIKAACDYVTTTCAEHGFANAIYKFALEEK